MKEDSPNDLTLYFPTSKQILLLKAGLLPTNFGINFWHEWLATNGLNDSMIVSQDSLSLLFDPQEASSQLLLPFVGYNLKDTKDPFIYKLKGHLRRQWLVNQKLLHVAQSICKIFNQVNIQSVLLQGLSMSLVYYKSLEIALSYGLHLGVSVQDKDAVINLLTSSNFKLSSGVRTDTFSIFDVPTSKEKIYIHWHLFEENPSAKVDNLFWTHTQLIDLGEGVMSNVLTPTYQLLYTIATSIKHHRDITVSWVADAVFLAKNYDINWAEIIEVAHQLKYTYLFQLALPWLQKEFKLEIPPHLLQHLAKLEATHCEISYLKQLKTIPTPSRLKHYFQKNYYLYHTYLKEYDTVSKPYSRWFIHKVFNRIFS